MRFACGRKVARITVMVTVNAIGVVDMLFKYLLLLFFVCMFVAVVMSADWIVLKLCSMVVNDAIVANVVVIVVVGVDFILCYVAACCMYSWCWLVNLLIALIIWHIRSCNTSCLAGRCLRSCHIDNVCSGLGYAAICASLSSCYTSLLCCCCLICCPTHSFTNRVHTTNAADSRFAVN